MTWPNATISTTNLDAGTDEPRLARADLLDAVQKLNTIISDGLAQAIIELTFTSEYRSYGSRKRANVILNYSTFSNVVKIVDNGEVEFQPGVYQVDVTLCQPTVAGDWQWSANISDFSFGGSTYSVTVPGTGVTYYFPILQTTTTIFYANTVTTANLNFNLTNSSPVKVMKLTKLS